MSELAYTISGDTFEVPTTVTDWRVRRLKPRGAPELVYGADGRPLTVSIEAGLDELHDAVSLSGKYRLDPIGDDGKAVENVPPAYIQVTKARNAAANDQMSERSTNDARASGASGGLELAVLEAVRLNTEAIRHAAEANAAALRYTAEISMRALDKLDKMPDIMAAMATLLNVAAGTQLHALQQREPQPPVQAHRNDAGETHGVDEDNDASDDDDTDDFAEVEDQGPASMLGGFLKAAGFDVTQFLTDMTTKGFSFIHGAASKVKLPSLGAIVDPRKAYAGAQQGAAAHTAQPVRVVDPQAAPPPTVVPSTIAPATATALRHATTEIPPSSSTPATKTPTPSTLKELLSDRSNARRFAAVRKGLSPAEQMLIGQVMQAFTENDLVVWISTLLALSVPDAIALVRADLARVQAEMSAAPDDEESEGADDEPGDDDERPDDGNTSLAS